MHAPDALRLVLDPSLPDSARDLRPEDFWDGLSAPFGGASISIKVFLAGFDNDEDAACVLADCLVSQEPMVACLTWLVMPRLARLFHVWLHPLHPDRRST